MLKKLLKYFSILIVIGSILFGLFIVAVYKGAFGELHTEEDLKDFKNQTASIIYADNGEILGKFFAENRTNIQFEQLPKQLVNALVATEDARYFEHEGVDSRSMLRVLFKSILLNNKNAGGGSTITQQLAKNMYGRERFGPLTMLVNKTKEAILATKLEEVYSKEEILTLYLNTVPFGENIYGIEAASRRFFNKPVTDIKIEEAAVLIGMLKANTYYNPRLYPDNALQRRNVVLSQMEKYEYLNSSTKDSLQQLPLQLDYADLESEGPANYFLVHVKKEAQQILDKYNKDKEEKYDLEKDGLIITTTLDYTLQKQALNAFKKHLGSMQKKLSNEYRNGNKKNILENLVNQELKSSGLSSKANERKNREIFDWNGFYIDSISVKDSVRNSLTLLHAGLLAMNPQTGAVKAWVGGIDYKIQPYDQIFAQRQIASTFKPILYVTALEQGASPCDYLDNDALTLTDFDNWQPQNYDNTTGGNYSVAAALAMSKNIPTINLYLQTSTDALQKTWVDLEFSQPLENKPSVALGTASASIYELTKAYASFANNGYSIEPKLIKSIKKSDGTVIFESTFTNPKESSRKLSKNSTQLLTAMLQKAIDEGTGASIRSTYGIQMPLAGKTGTSQDYADAWFAAYNPKLVIVTRVGASLPVIHFTSGSEGSGSKLALPIVARTLQYVQKKYSATFEPLPDELIEITDCEDYTEDSGLEKFFEGIFKKDKTTLDKAKKRAERKAKRKQRKAAKNNL